MSIDHDKLVAELAGIEARDALRTSRAGLEPCRCGAAPRLIDRTGSFDFIKGAFIECRACGMSTGLKDTAEEAIATWQPAAATAAQPDPRDAEIERLRALLENHSQRGQSHECRACGWRYAPAGQNENCPKCGHDGIGPATEAAHG